jgi:hypothetical protein
MSTLHKLQYLSKCIPPIYIYLVSEDMSEQNTKKRIFNNYTPMEFFFSISISMERVKR